MDLELATKRLAIIRYLYDTAVQQSLKPEPFCLSSILTFHDCIELFLELTAEHVDKGKSGQDFMGYWDLLSTKIPGGLSLKEQCRQLNTARVGLKHSGILPSKLAIEGFRSTAKSFFEENTPKIFSVNFSEISLIELVFNEKAKKYLQEAQTLLKDHKTYDALDKVALAFNILVDGYEESKRDEWGRSPFFFGSYLTFNNSSFMHNQEDLRKFLDKVKKSLDAIQEAIKFLSLGFDYKRYARFRLLTPVVMRFGDGKYRTLQIKNRKYVPSEADVDFCINFTIESALILQEFDYSLEHGNS